MNKWIVAMAILLTACGAQPTSYGVAPVAQAPTATYGVAGQSVLVQAAQESLAETQAVLSAQIAEATQRAAVATAEWQATYSALSVEQTQMVMRAEADARTATAQSQSDIATATAQAMAGQATQESADTATAQAFNGILMQQAIKSTGTSLAIRADSLATQESATAETEANTQRVQRLVTEIIQWAAGFGFIAICIVAVYFAILIGEDWRRHNIKIQEKLLLTAGYKADVERGKSVEALIIQVDGMSYFVEADGTLRPITPETVERGMVNLAHDSKWRAACRQMVYAAIKLGRDGEPKPFSERALAIENPIVTHPGTDEGWIEGYRMLMAILKAAGVLYAERGKAATWAKGWDYYRFEKDFPSLPLRDLPDGPPPDVHITLRTSEVSEHSRTFELPNSPEEDGQP